MRFGSSHLSILNCIYKIKERKVKFNAALTGGLLKLGNLRALSTCHIDECDDKRQKVWLAFLECVPMRPRISPGGPDGASIRKQYKPTVANFS